MENRHIIRVLFKGLLVTCVCLAIGVVFGVIFEILMPSEFKFRYLSVEEIYSNNISALFRTIIYGIMSLGVYACFFIMTFGNVIGRALVIIYSDYGLEGIVSGFFPHAGMELLSCILAAMVSIYVWLMFLNTFIKKVDMPKKTVILRSLVMVLIGIIAMSILCYGAAYMECNVTETYWMEKIIT